MQINADQFRWHAGHLQITLHPMNYCDLTLPTPAENIACDEALLDAAEEGSHAELLRVWEPVQHFLVIGYGNKMDTEVNRPFCQANNIPVLRRCSGGGAVLQGPGCLNYTLILSMEASPALQSIPGTNQFVLERHRALVADLLQAPVERQGQTDLAIRGMKFSGNAQRRKKHFLIFHGTFLLDLDIALMQQALPLPSKQPAYRLNRGHGDFVINLKLPANRMKEALVKCWSAGAPLGTIPRDRMCTLVREKYSRTDWNFKF